MEHNPKEKLLELLADYESAVLVTLASQGLHARPMTMARVDDDCTLWFVTSKESAKAHEIEVDQKAWVICQDGSFNCVCVSGLAVLDLDRAKLEAIWKSEMKSWFPQGLDDPDLALIRLEVLHGEYWDQTGVNRLVIGNTTKIKEGEQHGRVEARDN